MWLGDKTFQRLRGAPAAPETHPDPRGRLPRE